MRPEPDQPSALSRKWYRERRGRVEIVLYTPLRLLRGETTLSTGFEPAMETHEEMLLCQSDGTKIKRQIK